jgi:hypothetical protein
MRMSPMGTIRCTCPRCGSVDLTADDVVLRIRAGSVSNTYCFSCSSCKSFVEKRADAAVLRLLLSGGVAPTFVSGPAETLEVHEGPRITQDDLLNFHEMLKTADCLAELIANHTS